MIPSLDGACKESATGTHPVPLRPYPIHRPHWGSSTWIDEDAHPSGLGPAHKERGPPGGDQGTGDGSILARIAPLILWRCMWIASGAGGE
jgi:hypothetical protein